MHALTEPSFEWSWLVELSQNLWEVEKIEVPIPIQVEWSWLNVWCEISQSFLFFILGLVIQREREIYSFLLGFFLLSQCKNIK